MVVEKKSEFSKADVPTRAHKKIVINCLCNTTHAADDTDDGTAASPQCAI